MKEDIYYQFEENPPRQPLYEGYDIDSTYLTMRDGVKLAADLYFPKKLPSGKKVPTILIQTCYWRSIVFRKPFRWVEKRIIRFNYHDFFTRYGFAIVRVDVRGTGASFGTRPYPWSEEEIKDNKDIIDWIISQPWSDRNVISWGNSYLGTTAELAGAVNHPALKGLGPMHNEFDPYLDIAFPGGIYDEAFIEMWARATRALDLNKPRAMSFFRFLIMKSVTPVASDKEKILLREASREHISNTNIAEMAIGVTFRDDTYGKSGATSENFSVYHYKEDIDKSKVPMFCWGSWMDAATASTTIERFINYRNPLKGIIGAWTHGALWHASPYLPLKKTDPNPFFNIQGQEWVRFFDSCVKEEEISEKTLVYYTMGEEKWKMTTKWPPKGHSMQKWYFTENNELSLTKSQTESGEDEYLINFKVSTGKENRWYTELGGGLVFYRKRAKEGKKMLVYMSSPLKEDVELTGYPIVTLFMTSTHEDGAIFVYLEDMDESRKVIYITEGQLRLIHRKISSESTPYKILVPYHSFNKKDALPMVPDKIAEVTFALLPTSVLIRRGHRIRIAIAGADKDTFARIPADGTPLITISRNKNHPSFIDLPVIKK